MVILFMFFVGQGTISAALPSITIALLFDGTNSEPLASALKNGMVKQGLVIQEQALVDTVAKGLAFNNLFNLTKSEARGVAASLGTDFFWLLRLQEVERAGLGANLYQECYLALSLVNARSGDLVIFDFIEAQAASRSAALTSVITEVGKRLEQYVQRLKESFDKQLQPPPQFTPEELIAVDLTMPGATPSVGFQPPIFTARRQPEYTEIARKMAISAIVELHVMFNKDGRVGKVEVVHWAGFGLDEAATAAVRELQFKPATLNEQPIGCRALIRYNFNYKK